MFKVLSSVVILVNFNGIIFLINNCIQLMSQSGMQRKAQDVKYKILLIGIYFETDKSGGGGGEIPGYSDQVTNQDFCFS